MPQIRRVRTFEEKFAQVAESKNVYLHVSEHSLRVDRKREDAGAFFKEAHDYLARALEESNLSVGELRASLSHIKKTAYIYNKNHTSFFSKSSNENYKRFNQLVEGVEKYVGLLDLFGEIPEDLEIGSGLAESLLKSMQTLLAMDKKLPKTFIEKWNGPHKKLLQEIWKKSKETFVHNEIEKIISGLSHGFTGDTYLSIQDAMMKADFNDSKQLQSMADDLKKIIESGKVNSQVYLRRLGTIITLLEHAEVFPKTIEQLSNQPKSLQVRSFCIAAGVLSAEDPIFGRRLLIKLSKMANSPLLKELAHSLKHIDLSETKVDRVILEGLSGFHLSLKDISFGDIIGDETVLDIPDECPPELAYRLIQRFGSRLKQLRLPANILFSEELAVIYKRKGTFPSVRELIVRKSPGDPDSRVLKIIDLTMFLSVFPSLLELSLPSIDVPTLNFVDMKWADILPLLGDVFRFSATTQNCDKKVLYGILNAASVSAPTRRALFNFMSDQISSSTL